MVPATTHSSGDKDLESATNHALDIEGHRFRIHLCEAWLLHYFRIDAIRMPSRLEHNPRERHRRATLGFDVSGERNQPLYIKVIAGAFPVLEPRSKSEWTKHVHHHRMRPRSLCWQPRVTYQKNSGRVKISRPHQAAGLSAG